MKTTSNQFAKATILITLIFFTINPIKAQDWKQLGVDINGELYHDESGKSISISADGNLIAIGAPRANKSEWESGGHVRIYEWDGNLWSQKGTDIDAEESGDYLGWSVNLSGDGSTVAIGAIYNNGSESESGHARVYVWDGNDWVQQGADIDGDATGDRFGYSVTLSDDGSRLAVGAIFNEANGFRAGQVRVFDWSGTEWMQQGADILGNQTYSNSGFALDLSAGGDTLVVGIPFQNFTGISQGAAKMYRWTGSTWSQIGSDIYGESEGDYFGVAVQLSSDGSSVIIGGLNNDGAATDAGHARVFIWSGSDWTQKGLDLDGAEGDKAGSSVSINSDGSVIAVGSQTHNGNGANSGKARIYQWSGAEWILKGSDIFGEASQDFLNAVSLSADGHRVAVGAALNDGNGSDSGHVRIFDFDETPPSITISTSTASPFSSTSFPVTFTLSEIDTHFAIEDVSVTNGTISNFNGSGTIYTATITPTVDGLVSVDVLEDSFTDVVGNNNIAATTLTLDYEDITPPSITISSSIITTHFNNATLPLTFTLSEPSSDFDATDVTLINGSISNFTGSGAEYTANVTPIDQGDVSISVLGNSFSDAVNFTNTESNTLTLTWDNIAPEIIVSSTASTPFYESSFNVSFTLSEDLPGFEETDISVENGTLSNFSGSGTNFAATITPSTKGTVVVEVTESSITDTAGNNNPASEFSLAYGIPYVSSFAPMSAAVGSSITITGNGFDDTPVNNIVYFGDVPGTVTSASNTQLVVTAPIGATYEPISILVDEYVAKTTLPFSVSFDAPDLHGAAFADRVELNLPEYSYPRTAVSHDLDGDGLSDIVALNSNGKNFCVFRNSSTGPGSVSFDSRLDIATEIHPWVLALDDLDGDGLPDVIVSEVGANTNIAIFRNTSTSGSISFASAVTINNLEYIIDIAISDIDGDGRLDIASTSNNKIYIHANTSTGSGNISFDTPVGFATSKTSYSLTAGDLDSDGKPELIQANTYDASISILRNISSPGIIDFDAPEELATNNSSESVRVADLDHDGLLDIISDSRGLTIFRNTSTGVSDISFSRQDDESYSSISDVADLDGDGYVDISDVYTDKISLYHNQESTPGNISFDEPVAFITGDYHYDYSLDEEVSPGASNSLFFDADNDGKLDALVTNYNINKLSIHRNQLNETDISSFSLSEQTGPATIDLVNASVEIEVPNSVSTDALVATFGLSPGATATVTGVSQASGSTSNDFTEAVTYLVTASNGTTRNWIVNVRKLVIWDGANWNSAVPTVNQNVSIEGDFSFSENGTFAAHNITIEAGNELLVDGENTLTINNSLVNNGSMTVTSGSSLITFESGSISGNDLIVKRNTRYSDGKYSFVGTPVNQDASIIGSNLGSSVYKYNESTSYGSDDGLARWEDASMDELIPGIGYTQAMQQEVEFEGVPNNGTVTVTGKYTHGTESGWNLVSNPYTSAISVADFLATNNNTTGSIYIWDDNGSNTERGTNSDYIVANGSMATNTTPAGGDTRYNYHIGSGQGFFVRLTRTYLEDFTLDREIEFNEDMREIGNNADDNFFRETAMPILRINLTDRKGLFKQTVIGLSEDASTNKINRTYDAPAFNENAKDGIFTVKADQKLSLNGLSAEWSAVPIQLNIGEEGIYQISAELEEYHQPIYLLDKKAGQIIDLKKESYSFMIDAGVFNERFQLLSSPSEVLGLQPDQNLIYGYEKVLYIRPYSNEAREYTLLSISGKKLLQGTFSGAEEVNLYQYPAGVYLVNDGQKTHKIILK